MVFPSTVAGRVPLDIGLFVASHAGRALRREEAPPSLFPAAVAAVIPLETSSPEVTQGGKEEQDN